MTSQTITYPNPNPNPNPNQKNLKIKSRNPNPFCKLADRPKSLDRDMHLIQYRINKCLCNNVYNCIAGIFLERQALERPEELFYKDNRQNLFPILKNHDFLCS